jgi:hypothetical protein
MMLRRLIPVIAAAICMCGLGLGASQVASAAVVPASGAASGAVSGALAARHTSAGMYSQLTVVLNCQGQPRVRPGSYVLACADANDYLTRLSWRSWGPGLASATGVQKENDCVPDCASGHFRSYPVNVVFWGSAAARPGEQRFTKVTLLYPGARPPAGHRPGPATVTMSLWP